MTYQRFEDLPVWQAAQDFALRIYALTESAAFTQIRKGDLTDQLRRASLSVSNNIAEGFERGTTPELLAFLYIARGSAGEARSMLHFSSRLPHFSNLKSEISNLVPLAESCSRQLRAWADSLQNSDIPGQRHLNDQVRQAFTAHQRSAAFLEKLQSLTPHLRPPQPPEEETP